jgi:hypothetical protein
VSGGEVSLIHSSQLAHDQLFQLVGAPPFDQILVAQAIHYKQKLGITQLIIGYFVFSTLKTLGYHNPPSAIPENTFSKIATTIREQKQAPTQRVHRKFPLNNTKKTYRSRAHINTLSIRENPFKSTQMFPHSQPPIFIVVPSKSCISTR